MKILITGFQPFHGETVNPSQKLLSDLADGDLIETLELPVSYGRAWPLLQQKLESNHYQFVLMLGMAGGRGKISLERVALNYIDFERPDEDGQLLTEHVIDTAEDSALWTDLPLRKWLDFLNGSEALFQVSNSAGTFVCNSLFFHFLRWQKQQSLPVPGFFVHVPYLPEQQAGKAPGTPVLSMPEMSRSLQKLIHLIRWGHPAV